MSHQESTERESEPDGRKISFWRTMLSVLQASYGVQNKKNKERDFQQGSIKGFIAAALIFTAVFILALVTIVALVLP